MDTTLGRAPAPLQPPTSTGMDLRGANFEGQSLAGADLRSIRTGLKPGGKALLVAAALLVSIALGVITGLGARYLMALIHSGDPRKVALALNASAAVVVYLLAGLWKGGQVATRTVLPVVAALFGSGAVIAIATGVGTGVGAFATLGFVLIAAAVVTLAALARAVAGTAGTALFTLVAIAGGLAGGFVGGGIPAAIMAVVAMLVGKRAMKSDQHYPFLTRLTVKLVCKGGTRFRGSDLSGADLSGAELTACDFRHANLTGAHLDGASIRMCLFDDDRAEPPRAK